MTETTQLQHVSYPHEPGRLFDCPACEARCHCRPGEAECVFEGEHEPHVCEEEAVECGGPTRYDGSFDVWFECGVCGRQFGHSVDSVL